MNKSNISKILSIILFLLVMINISLNWMTNSLLSSAYTTPGVIEIGDQILFLIGQSIIYLIISIYYLGLILIPVSSITLMIELWKSIRKENINKIVMLCSFIILLIAILQLVTNSIIYPILLNISSFDPLDYQLMIYNLEFPMTTKNFIDLFIFMIMLPSALIMLILGMRTIVSTELDD
ncbi:MAG: hypothetical protein ACFFBP_05385 [Promethearchaeota archaeon]